MPTIAIKFQSDKKLCRNLGLALLYACMSDSTDIAVPKNICSPVCSAYSSLELGETLPVTKNPLLIYRIGERLAICEITGNDRGGGGGVGSPGVLGLIFYYR